MHTSAANAVLLTMLAACATPLPRPPAALVGGSWHLATGQEHARTRVFEARFGEGGALHIEDLPHVDTWKATGPCELELWQGDPAGRILAMTWRPERGVYRADLAYGTFYELRPGTPVAEPSGDSVFDIPMALMGPGAMYEVGLAPLYTDADAERFAAALRACDQRAAGSLRAVLDAVGISRTRLRYAGMMVGNATDLVAYELSPSYLLRAAYMTMASTAFQGVGVVAK